MESRKAKDGESQIDSLKAKMALVRQNHRLANHICNYSLTNIQKSFSSPCFQLFELEYNFLSLARRLKTSADFR